MRNDECIFGKVSIRPGVAKNTTFPSLALFFRKVGTFSQEDKKWKSVGLGVRNINERDCMSLPTSPARFSFTPISDRQRCNMISKRARG